MQTLQRMNALEVLDRNVSERLWWQYMYEKSMVLCEVLEICIVDPRLISSAGDTAETHFRLPL